jgi:hypothetical protein
MRIRRFLAAAAATMVAAAGVAGVAAPAASAAELGPDTVACNEPSRTLNVTGSVGDTFTVVSTTPINCEDVTTSVSGVVTWSADDTCPLPDPDAFCGYSDYDTETGTIVVITLAQPGTTTWRARANTSDVGLTVTFTVTGTTTAAGSGATEIPAWVQAYGRSGADATCEDGWAPSWQSWAEPVTGGWVCTRSIPSLG